ncbi:flavodoxin domain-containing protein, partial [Variovorax sp. CT11-76]
GYAGLRGHLRERIERGHRRNWLVFGDRHYARFCGFGHALDHALVAAGAQSLFPMIEVDNGDTAALARWRRQLVALRGADAIPAEALADEPLEPAFEPWTLGARRLLNPGSLGAPLYEIELAAPPEAAAAWRPGALAELQPRLAADTVAALLRATPWTADAPVVFQGRHCTLAEALARSAVPAPQALVQGLDAQALADALVPLATRRYSIASLPSEGHVRLLVRQARHEQGLGIASGWLTAHAPLTAQVPLRLLANPGFAPVADDRPCIFVGNGSGYAGLRGHLRERIERGHRRNWLVFG